METKAYVQLLLESLGVSKRFRGHSIAAEAICRVLSSGDGLVCLHKQVYIPLATHYACSWQHLERNLRTAIQRAWQINPELLQELAAYPLDTAPTVSEFIDILSTYVLRHGCHHLFCTEGHFEP